MQVAILSESSADETALRVLTDSVLGVTTTSVEFSLRTRGYSGVQGYLPVIIKRLHYHTQAEGLVVVVDSNHSSVVEAGADNRLTEIQAVITRELSLLRPVAGRVPLKVALGVASPAIEAWLLCKSHADVSEGRWEDGLKAKIYPYSKVQLKNRLYGVDFPPLTLETEKMKAAAVEIAKDIIELERKFPFGFGHLAKQLRDWRRVA